MVSDSNNSRPTVCARTGQLTVGSGATIQIAGLLGRGIAQEVVVFDKQRNKVEKGLAPNYCFD